MDKLTSEKRSALMARIRSKDTRPEVVVRSILHHLGYRFRLHRKDLPGKPDIVLPKHRKVVLVHGCFWHGHNCRLASKPKSNVAYWRNKLKANHTRDEKNLRALDALGWKVLVIWECEVRRMDGLAEKLDLFIKDDTKRGVHC